MRKELNYPYAAGKSGKDRDAAIQRMYKSDVGKMLWFAYVVISAFIGNIAVLYVIVQLVLKSIKVNLW